MADLATIQSVYRGSDGRQTLALYGELGKLGPAGAIAINLFRACKCSERAKAYRRGPGHKTAAYERKDWSIGNLAKVLQNEQLIAALGLRWGWGLDDALKAEGDPHHHIIYVDLPEGQVSFHTGTRGPGPDYAGHWDGTRNLAASRICLFVAAVFEKAEA
jgi:hypothetical protein